MTGELTVDIPTFNPSVMVAAPAGTTHFKIIGSGAAIDFEGKSFVADTSSSAVLPWDATPTVAINHVNQVTAASPDPLFLILGIEFYQEVSGEMYALQTAALIAAGW